MGIEAEEEGRNDQGFGDEDEYVEEEEGREEHGEGGEFEGFEGADEGEGVEGRQVGNEVTVVLEAGRLLWDRNEVFGSLRVEVIERIEAVHEAQVRAEEAHRVEVGVEVGVEVEVETEAEAEGIEAEVWIGLEKEGREGGEDEGGGRDEIEVGRTENETDDEKDDRRGLDDFLAKF
jgi:hypothetical protein